MLGSAPSNLLNGNTLKIKDIIAKSVGVLHGGSPSHRSCPISPGDLQPWASCVRCGLETNNCENRWVDFFLGGYDNQDCHVKSLTLDVTLLLVASGVFVHPLYPKCTQQHSTSPITHQQDWMEASGAEMMKRSRECVPQECGVVMAC